jgi:hypothetical protein
MYFGRLLFPKNAPIFLNRGVQFSSSHVGPSLCFVGRTRTGRVVGRDSDVAARRAVVCFGASPLSTSEKKGYLYPLEQSRAQLTCSAPMAAAAAAAATAFSGGRRSPPRTRASAVSPRAEVSCRRRVLPAGTRSSSF